MTRIGSGVIPRLNRRAGAAVAVAVDPSSRTSVAAGAAAVVAIDPSRISTSAAAVVEAVPRSRVSSAAGDAEGAAAVAHTIATNRQRQHPHGNQRTLVSATD